MNIDIFLTRESDKRLKATARTHADEYGSQIEVTKWSDATPQGAHQIAALVGSVVIKAGLSIPSDPEDFSLKLTPDPRLGATVVARQVVVDGDSENMRALINGAILQDEQLRITYTRATDEENEYVVRPTELDRGPGGRWMKALHDGVRKSFYLYRISRAEVVR